MKQSGTILVVDDVSNGPDRFETYLAGQGHQVVFADSGIEALDKAAEAAPDAIVRDVPVPDAVDTCQQVRVSEALSQTPVAMLAAAFDGLLGSWGQALELRGVEPEGHTQRVAGMALQLAHAMGMGDDELVHVCRGATLHDIGKMGIPDRIMFKVGPLDDEEWAEMYKHPLYAHDLLAPIAYLQPALDIPYCHHEKWDGTGYPRGLKGDEIPLSARIFAVVDVWDALHADRSYRRAWSESQVDDYIHEQAGHHFDPEVVRAFFDLLQRA